MALLDLSLTSGRTHRGILGRPLVGEAEPRKPSGPGPPRPILRGHRGMREGQGPRTLALPHLPVLPEALFQSPFPDGAHLPLSPPPALPSVHSQAEAGSTQPWTRAGRRSEAQACSGTGEAWRPSLSRGGPQAGGAGSRGQAVIPELGPRPPHLLTPPSGHAKLHSHSELPPTAPAPQEGSSGHSCSSSSGSGPTPRRPRLGNSGRSIRHPERLRVGQQLVPVWQAPQTEWCPMLARCS